MKRIISLFLSLVISIGILAGIPVNVSATNVNGDFEYKYINNSSEISITGYVGPGGDVYIPNKIDGKYVTAIEESAFYGNTSITYVWMSDYVTSVGEYAFYECTSIENIDFGNGLKTIGNSAFAFCTSLESIVLPDSIEEIYYDYDYGTFQDCTSLISVVIGNGLKAITREAFLNCTSLESVVFGNSIESVDRGAFYNCTKLKKINLPDSLKTIGKDAFCYASSLENIDFGNGLKTIGDGAFAYCKSLESIVLPDSLVEICYDYDYGTFQDCTSLKSVVIGDGLKIVSRYCFGNCTSLESVAFGKSIECIDREAFYNCNKLKTLNLPDSLKIIGKEAFYCASSIKSIDFGNGLKTIGDGAFAYCKSLESIVLPDSLEEICYDYDYGAFQDCTSLKSVVIGDGLKIVSRYCFGNCTSLESVAFGKSIEYIDREAFYNCNKLKTLNLPDSLKTIGKEAFYCASSIKSIDFGNGLKTIGDGAFAYCKSLESIVLPDSLEEICYDYDYGTFQDCTSLKSVVIGDGLKIVSRYCFGNCTSLESVVAGNALESINRDAFRNCSNLKKISFAGMMPSVNEGNEPFDNANWYYLPTDNDFTKGEQSGTYQVVTIDCNGGETLLDDEELESYTKYADFGKVSAPLLPTREGYTFKGWYLNSQCTGTQVDFNELKVNGEKTLYAKWEKNTYRIFFDPRGGSVSLGGKEVKYGDSIGELPTPALDGDTFDGWYLGMNSSGPQYTATSKMPAKDIILYAGWQINDSATTVIFDTTGGSFVAPVSVSAGSTVGKPADPTRAGYEFIGWYADSNHATKFNFAETAIDANTTIYAHWKANPPTTPVVGAVENVTSNSASVSWSAVDSVKAYYIYLNGAFYTGVSADENQCSLENLQDSTQYTVGIAAVNSSAISEITTAEFKTLHTCTPCDWIIDTEATVNDPGSKHTECVVCKKILQTAVIKQLKCNRPSMKKISVNAASVGITWGAVAGADEYKVYRKVGSGTYKYLTKTGNTSYTDKSVKSGYKYSYKVCACNEAGDSSESNALSTTFLAKPKLSGVSNSSTGVKISWNKVAGASSYNIYRKTGKGEFQKIGSSEKLSYFDKTAKSGKKYVYAVKAVKSGVSSVGSSSKSVTYLAMPKLTKITATKGKVTFTFGKVAGATTYEIYRKTGNGLFKKVASVKTNKYVDKKVSKGKYYTYTVKAVKGSAKSVYNTKGLRVKAK